MDEDQEHKLQIERAKDLLEQRKTILSLPPEEAMDRILEARHPAALVQSFAKEDFYFLVHDIGPEDSLPLLNLASTGQWEYVLDLEVWKKDRIDLPSVIRWLDYLFRADPTRLAEWTIGEKAAFFKFILYKNIQVIVREHDQDPSDFGQDFVTFDETYYFRFIDTSFDSDTGKKSLEDRNDCISKILASAADLNHVKFQQLLLEAASLIPAESEEENYRLRNVRLAESGFLPFDEAIGIYQPLDPQDIGHRGLKILETKIDPAERLPVPLYTIGMIGHENRFTDALQLIDSHQVLDQLQGEFAGLANQIIAADQHPVTSRKDLTTVLKKACGYLSIGLDALSAEKSEPAVYQNASRDVSQDVALIKAYPLSDIFKIGYGLALKMKWRAKRWRQRCWFVSEGLPLRFWDEDWMGVLGGLFVNKPLFFDNYRTGVLYREFASTDDIRKTENALNEIIAFDDLLSFLHLKKDSTTTRTFLTYKNLILTSWARDYLGLPESPVSSIPVPMTIEEFKQFFQDLWIGGEKTRKIRLSMKEAFLTWLANQSDIAPSEIIGRVGKTLESLFSEIEDELGKVSKKDLDPRFIQLILIETPE